MSKAAEYRALERQIAEQLAALEALKGSSALQKELEFEEKLRKLLNEYGMSLRNVVNILDPQAGRGQVQVQAKAPRKERAVKRYHNPHTGEVVETKGGNHKTLKEWKQQYGSDVVESWVQ
ncbi:DNA binding protein [Pseudomonas putida]|uniref:Transcriptional regulator n=1 Tax=Pseudomonas taiwanensis SJ9 TaxID=1388762 RepID=V7DA43_9PSED|nr:MULTISPECIES: histone-like nucleoid-structuring protein, MvaT/MvaU family [Pseudomonas]ESW39159.1 transcriptional regulator [Pseudomonas taiwanensis SJ9]MCO7057153.1 DNA binding protein [Pseudomonas juntendi]MDO1496262.1 DNA binding protein [Pseudomonas putida]UJM14038.1 DNA binding protein [Pseudomonas juntendi]